MKYKVDSRKVKKGDTFIAIKEEMGDGHNYILDAIKNGAKHIVCEEGLYEVDTLVVKDTHKYLVDVLKKEYGDMNYYILSECTVVKQYLEAKQNKNKE